MAVEILRDSSYNLYGTRGYGYVISRYCATVPKHIVWPYIHQHSKKGILHKGGETNIPC